jgi:hypothetical protein
MTELLFGSDPEFFVCENRNGEDYAIPVPHFIYDRGINPVEWEKDFTQKSYFHPVMMKEDNFKVIMDGVAFELTLPPVKKAEDMKKNLSDALNRINEFANKFNYYCVVKPTVKYNFYEWYEEGNKLKEHCGIFGCDRDEDAILENYICPNLDVREHDSRYGGGHWHLSDGNILIYKYIKPFVKLLACTEGNFCIKNSPYPELEKQRAFHYGQPGRYREQHYPDGNIGVEYRTPSNSWTNYPVEKMEEMFEWTKRAYFFLENFRVDIIDKYLVKSIEAIKNADQDLASEILDSISKE